MTIRELQEQVRAARASTHDARQVWGAGVGEQIALAHSELSEALEEWRLGRPLDLVYTTHLAQEAGLPLPELLAKGYKPEGFPIELADVLIRIADMAERYGIDLTAALEMKLAYNETRPYRHGGKVA